MSCVSSTETLQQFDVLASGDLDDAAMVSPGGEAVASEVNMGAWRGGIWPSGGRPGIFWAFGSRVRISEGRIGTSPMNGEGSFGRSMMVLIEVTEFARDLLKINVYTPLYGDCSTCKSNQAFEAVERGCQTSRVSILNVLHFNHMFLPRRCSHKAL